MGCRSLLSAMALVASLGLAGLPVVAQETASSDRVLAQKADGFNPAAVQEMINRGDAAAAAGDFRHDTSYDLFFPSGYHNFKNMSHIHI